MSEARKVFFSEEKKQKTFISQPLPISRPWPASLRSTRIKSLLLLFFRKEGLHFPFTLVLSALFVALLLVATIAPALLTSVDPLATDPLHASPLRRPRIGSAPTSTGAMSGPGWCAPSGRRC
jgi:hypothetical protein